MTKQYLALATAMSLTLCTSVAQATELVNATQLPILAAPSAGELFGGVNQGRYDLGFRFTIQGVAQQIVPGGLRLSDAVLCNLANAEGGYAVNGKKHRLSPMTCVPLNGFETLDAIAEPQVQWTGAVFLRAHAE